MDNLWLKVEHIVAKGEIGRLEQFLLLSLFLKKSRLLQRRQKAPIWGNGLINTITTGYLHRIDGFVFYAASNNASVI